MKQFLFICLVLLSTIIARSQSTTVVISQVYGGGSNTGATFNADFVELHNVSNVDQDISGFKILYGSSTGNLASSATNAFTFPPTGVIIPAGGYLLVAATAGATGSALPTPDYTFTLNLSGTNGKVAFGTGAMVNNTTLALQPAGSVIDFVGYGSANEFETAACPVLSATTAAIRNTNGCDDTNNNSTNFTVGTPNPRNSASPVAICGVTPVPPTISITTPLTGFGNVCINTTAGPNSFAISGTNLVAGDLTIGPLSGYTFSLLPAGPYVSTLTLPQTGGAYAAVISVQFTPTAVQSYAGNITVSGGGATTNNVAVTGFGVDETVITTGASSSVTSSSATVFSTLISGCDATISYGIEYSTNNGFAPGTGTQIASTNISGVSYSVPLSGLTQNTTYYYIAYAVTSGGTVYGLQNSFTTNIISTGGLGVVISQVYGGGGSATGTFNADYVELHNNTAATQDISGCKIMYGSATGNLGTSASSIFTFPSGSTIPSGGYILVATTAGTGLASLPVTADYTFAFNMSGTNGKIIFGSSSLVSNTTLVAQPAGTVFDFIGYGSANESETSPCGALSTTTAAFRNNNGCDDTNNNLADITIATPNPRNSTSPIAVCSALPVTFSSFDVRKSGNKALISWKTSFESNIRNFIVERSKDGSLWESIAVMNANNTSNIVNNYSYIDQMPLSGLNYYRIQSASFNNKNEYTQTKTLNFTTGIIVTTAPNPATTFVDVYLNAPNSRATLYIHDASGRMVRTLNLNNSRVSVNVSDLLPGVYTFKTINGNEVKINRVVIQ